MSDHCQITVSFEIIPHLLYRSFSFISDLMDHTKTWQHFSWLKGSCPLGRSSCGFNSAYSTRTVNSSGFINALVNHNLVWGFVSLCNVGVWTCKYARNQDDRNLWLIPVMWPVINSLGNIHRLFCQNPDNYKLL